MTLAEQFEALRPRLLRIAYGQLGSVAEAEDVLQDAWLRLERVDTDAIRDLEGVADHHRLPPRRWTR